MEEDVPEGRNEQKGIDSEVISEIIIVEQNTNPPSIRGNCPADSEEEEFQGEEEMIDEETISYSEIPPSTINTRDQNNDPNQARIKEQQAQAARRRNASSCCNLV